MPIKVEVFALGCARCKLIEVAARTAIEESGVDAEMIKIQDTFLMRERGLMAQPALFIDGIIKVAGRVPSVQEIKGMLIEENNVRGGKSGARGTQ